MLYMDCLPHLLNLFIYYFERRKEKEQPRLGQAEAKSAELLPGLPCWGQGPKYLGRPLVPPTVCVSRDWITGIVA